MMDADVFRRLALRRGSTSFIARVRHATHRARFRMATTPWTDLLLVRLHPRRPERAIPTFAVGVFTADLELQALIRTITPLMGLSQLVFALVLVERRPVPAVPRGSPTGCSAPHAVASPPAVAWAAGPSTRAPRTRPHRHVMGTTRIAVKKNKDAAHRRSTGAHVARTGRCSAQFSARRAFGSVTARAARVVRAREARRWDGTTVVRKRSSRTHRGPRLHAGMEDCAISIIFDRRTARGRGRRRGVFETTSS